MVKKQNITKIKQKNNFWFWGLKLKDIDRNNKNNNKIIINTVDGNIVIKYHFTFEEAFKVFYFLKSQRYF